MEEIGRGRGRGLGGRLLCNCGFRFWSNCKEKVRFKKIETLFSVPFPVLH